MSDRVFVSGKSINPSYPTWLPLVLGITVVLTAAAVALAVAFTPSPIFVALAAVVLPLTAAIILKPELGLAVLLFATFSRAFEVIIENEGALSPYTFFLGFLLMVVALRRIFWGERIDGWQAAAALFSAFGTLILAGLLYADYPEVVTLNLVYYIKDILMVLLVVTMMRDANHLRWAVWALLAAGIFLGTISAIQQLTGSFDNTFGGFAEVKVANIYEDIQGNRMGGPGLDPNVYGQYMLILLPLAWDRMFSEKTRVMRLLGLWAFAASLVAVVFTFSRGNFIGLVIMFGLLLAMRPPRLIVWLAGLAILLSLTPYIPREYTDRLVTLTYVLPDFNSPDSELMPNVNQARQEISFRGRLSENIVGVQMSLDHPLIGVGYGNFKEHYQSYSRKLGLDPRREGRSAHNLYLEIFAEMGVVGLIWFIALNVVTFLGLQKAARRFASAGFTDLAGLPTAMMVSILGLLITSIFLHMVYPRYFWMVYAVALGMPNAAEKEMNRAFVQSKWKEFRGIFHAGEQHA